jgi:hypothetical protein
LGRCRKTSTASTTLPTVLPMRHSDLLFSLLMHIDMTRTRSAALQRLNTAA